jgi:hypothetical protein
MIGVADHGAAPPADPAPRAARQHGLGCDRGLARHGVLARPPGARRRPAQLDRRRVDVLGLQDADRPDEAARAQAPAEGGTRAVAGVGQHGPEPGAGGEDPVDLGERDVGLRLGPSVLVRHPRPGAAVRVGHPLVRQEQARAERHRDLAPGQGEGDEDLAVGLLAEPAAVLARHAGRERALPCFGSAVSSTTSTAAGPPTSASAFATRSRRKGASLQAGLAMKWCSWSWPFWPSRAAMGWRLLRSPGPSRPCR